MRNYVAIILFTNNLMVRENAHDITLSGKKRNKKFVYIIVSAMLLKVCVSLLEVFLY